MHDQIKTVVANVLGIPRGSITDDASVDTIESWDSLRQIRLLMALEEKFQVTFGDDEITKLTSLPAIMQAIEQHKNGF
jgi:acyl carrier protein